MPLLPGFMTDPQFWPIMLPVVIGAFVAGMAIRPARIRIQKIRSTGIGGLLGNASDQAIDLLEKSSDSLRPDTLNTYLALGNLFRGRGEFDRATRIHESIVGRQDTPRDMRLTAQINLGRDHTAAGLMDRAEAAFRQVLQQAPKKSEEAVQALKNLAQLLERQKRWAEALDVRAKLVHIKAGNPAAYAHLLYLLGEESLKDNNLNKARDIFEQAIATHTGCLPAWSALAKMDLAEKRPKAACLRLKQALEARPALFHLIEDVLVDDGLGAGPPMQRQRP